MKNSVSGLTSPDCKMCYKTIAIKKRVKYWPNKKRTDQFTETQFVASLRSILGKVPLEFEESVNTAVV